MGYSSYVTLLINSMQNIHIHIIQYNMIVETAVYIYISTNKSFGKCIAMAPF